MIGWTDRLLASLSYIPFFFVLIVFLSRKAFVVYHIKQGFVLSFVWLFWLYFSHFVPFLGWFITAPLGFIFLLVMTFLGIFRALKGEMKALPFFGSWVEKLRL